MELVAIATRPIADPLVPIEIAIRVLFGLLGAFLAVVILSLLVLQRVAGHQDPAVTARYLHPDVQAMLEAGTAFSAWWSVAGPERPSLGVIDGGKTVG